MTSLRSSKRNFSCFSWILPCNPRSASPQKEGTCDMVAALRNDCVSACSPIICCGVATSCLCSSSPLWASNKRRIPSRTVSNSMARPSSLAMPSDFKLVRRCVALLNARQKSRKCTCSALTFNNCWNKGGLSELPWKSSESMWADSGELGLLGMWPLTVGSTDGTDVSGNVQPCGWHAAQASRAASIDETSSSGSGAGSIDESSSRGNVDALAVVLVR
mmetsp:Transcript_31773/g.83569  ORF Transcript_31773/g.83569 Transcript_31773/m.83569 type:complete len:218 (-) Transcript_31773:204-857(-)